MTTCITEEAELNLKAYEVGDVLRKELDIAECNEEGNLLKPKEILALATAKLEGVSAASAASSAVESSSDTIKDKLRAIRAIVRRLPPGFWEETPTKIRPGSPNDELLTRILAKPATAGGFAAAIACRCLKPNVIDTKSITSRGYGVIDGVTILRGAGAYCTIDGEMENIGKLFRTERDAEKIGDCTFRVVDRRQTAPGQVVMTGKANKCEARFVALLTPKWCLVGIYCHAGSEAEEETLNVFEDMRLEIPTK